MIVIIFHCIYSPFILAKDDVEKNKVLNSGVEKKHFTDKYKRKADPLGQQARLPDSIPDTESTLLRLPTDKVALEHVIKKIQLILYLENLYTGDINGILNIETKRSIVKYKQGQGLLPGEILLDSPTLTSLGMIGK